VIASPNVAPTNRDVGSVDDDARSDADCSTGGAERGLSGVPAFSTVGFPLVISAEKGRPIGRVLRDAGLASVAIARAARHLARDRLRPLRRRRPWARSTRCPLRGTQCRALKRTA
jgi:hypothetical protein